MWKLFDELIELVPADLKVEDCLVGYNWTLVKSLTTGIALTETSPRGQSMSLNNISGMKLRQLASYIKSWDFMQASLGLAAINSIVNTRKQVERLTGESLEKQLDTNAFNLDEEIITGKKVAVIGHFPGIEHLEKKCELAILERQPLPGDYPDPACEYILPEMDYVFITGVTLINKTLPRLLELSKKAITVMVGPSTPLTPLLYKYGVNVLAGTVASDPHLLWKVIKEGGEGPKIFNNGAKRVKIINNME